jgi:3-oxoacyl-[acyl-carrier protein] reductase
MMMDAQTKFFDLSGKIAAVTGAAVGIGRGIAERFTAAGAAVAVADLNLSAAEKTASEINAAGGKAIAIETDVSNREAVEAMVAETKRQLGPIDILVNNAGIVGKTGPLWELNDEDWRGVLETNLTSIFYCCRAVLPDMMKKKWGRIVNIASIAGKEGNPNMIPYSTSKGGVIAFTKALAKELTQHNVLVNAVTPAVIRTPILDGITAEQIEYMTSRIPLGRVGNPEEVAAVVHFLASEDSSFVTGQVYDASGGRATY